MDQNVGSPLVYNSFTDIVCNSNGRNGISISAGRYLKFKNCLVENTAQGSFGQTPAMGIDIEPDGPIDTTNGDPLACSQLVFDSCRVKNSLGTAFAIIWRKGEFANHFIPQDIVIRNNSYFADYDDNIIESPNSTVDASGANVVFENSTIIGSFWRGCNPLHNTDYPKFINVNFLEDDSLGPGGSYKNSGYLFYSDNLCENMSFDQCQFNVNRHARLTRLIARYMNDSSKYSRFKDCNFIYASTHQENATDFSLFNGCVFLGNTYFVNLRTDPNTWAKKIKTAGIVLEGSLNPCQPSLFKLDNAITLTHMNSFLYDSTNVTLCGNVNLPFIIGPNLLISNNFIPSYANIEIPDNATFRASLYENYISGGCTSSSPPFLYIGPKGRFLMHGITNEPLLAAAITPILVQNEGQFILGPKSQVALNSASALNPIGNSNTFYFDPSIIHPWYYPNSSISMGGNCSYGLTNATNFTGLNPCATNYDQIKWDDKFTVYYRLQNNPCAGNSLGSIQYLLKGGTGNYIINIDGNTSSTNNNNLTTGTHTFTVTDAVNASCTYTFQFTITEPPSLFWSNIQATNPSCAQGSTGTITVSASGGTGTFNYSINSLSGQFTNLLAGTYIVTATDANGCTLTTSVTLTDPPALTWTSITATNPTCAQGSTGSINVSANGGTGTINYSINSPIGSFANLLAGTYIVTATDANGCTLTTSVTLTDPPTLNWSSITATNPSCSPGSDGQIIPLTTGGTGQVSMTPSVLTGLNAGIFPITATDANGCSISTSVTLYQPNANHCCSTTSNPNAGSNIASQSNIILLPNTQVSSLTAANLLSNYGSGGVIQGKKFYIDG
ncbi:MAG: SprB repeat-containing protein, partial [Bacteroidia bacterium]|nr:SprB repeat-containing protein [Bacteroidia bacterium]